MSSGRAAGATGLSAAVPSASFPFLSPQKAGVGSSPASTPVPQCGPAVQTPGQPPGRTSHVRSPRGPSAPALVLPGAGGSDGHSFFKTGRLQTGLEDTLGSSPVERGPVGWPPICSWGLSRTQKGMGLRAQGAGRRGQAGWWLPGPQATAVVHACGSVLCGYRAGLTTSPGFRRLQCVTGTLRWGGGS